MPLNEAKRLCLDYGVSVASSDDFCKMQEVQGALDAKIKVGCLLHVTRRNACPFYTLLNSETGV